MLGGVGPRRNSRCCDDIKKLYILIPNAKMKVIPLNPKIEHNVPPTEGPRASPNAEAPLKSAAAAFVVLPIVPRITDLASAVVIIAGKIGVHAKAQPTPSPIRTQMWTTHCNVEPT